MDDILGLVAGISTGGVTSLIGGLLGAAARLGTAVLQYKQHLADQGHEVEMTKLLTDREVQLSKARTDEARAVSDGHVDESWAEALKTATAMQGQLTGVKWLDVISQSVRPFITYWWMTLLTAYKACSLALVIETHGAANWKQAMAYSWTSDDQAILATIISFWFLDRQLRKKGL